MNKGPMSRLVKVPVKCRTCGKIKYNVVCESQINNEKKDKKTSQEKPVQKKPVENKQTKINQPKEKTYKKPKHYNYIETVVKKQSKIANKVYNQEKSRDSAKLTK